MKGVKAQKVADKNRYFHVTKKYPTLMVVNCLVSCLVGVLAQFWLIGTLFFAFAGLIILGDYLFWNNRLNTLLRSGQVTENEAREIMVSSEKGAGDSDSDPFLDADNCGMSGNIFHND